VYIMSEYCENYNSIPNEKKSLFTQVVSQAVHDDNTSVSWSVSLELIACVIRTLAEADPDVSVRHTCFQRTEAPIQCIRGSQSIVR